MPFGSEMRLFGAECTAKQTNDIACHRWHMRTHVRKWKEYIGTGTGQRFRFNLEELIYLKKATLGTPRHSL